MFSIEAISFFVRTLYKARNLHVSIEFFAFEILVLLAGMMLNSESNTLLIAMRFLFLIVMTHGILLDLNATTLIESQCKLSETNCCLKTSVSTEARSCMFTYGFYVAVRYAIWYLNSLWIMQFSLNISYSNWWLCDYQNTLVSNQIGAGNIRKAKNVVMVTLIFLCFLAITVIVLLDFNHNTRSRSFTSNPMIAWAFASITPMLSVSILLSASILFDSAQGVMLKNFSTSFWYENPSFKI